MPTNHDSFSLERFLRCSRIEEPGREQCRIKGDCFALYARVVPPGVVGPNDAGTTTEAENSLQLYTDSEIRSDDSLVFLNGGTKTAYTEGAPRGSHSDVSSPHNRACKIEVCYPHRLPVRRESRPSKALYIFSFNSNKSSECRSSPISGRSPKNMAKWHSITWPLIV